MWWIRLNRLVAKSWDLYCVSDLVDLKKMPWLLMQPWQDGISYLALTSWQLGEERGNLHNFQAHIKLRSVVFLKVQREVTILNRINISKSSWSPWLLWQITEKWIGKTHLHCSEMCCWSVLKRKIPFKRLKYNLLSHTPHREKVKKYIAGNIKTNIK